MTSPTPAWSLDASGGAAATMTLVDVEPLTAASPHSAQIDVASLGSGGRSTLVNSGYWGINVSARASYRLSLYLRTDDSFRGPVTAALETAGGAILAWQVITSPSSSTWRKHDITLTATAGDPKARFALTLGSTGRIWVDFVSLFPARTWRDRRNGLRPDLAELIAAMKPAFIRWPGGCFAEGITIESRPQWKKSLGRLDDRDGSYSPWGYWSTDGVGYHEFLQFSEDTGARGGSVTVLTSAKPDDENTFEMPALITPKTTPLAIAGPAFTHVFPAYSLSIIRVKTRQE